VVRGHALSMPALHGGNAPHDRIDAQNLAGLRRGGMRPPAYGSPAERRATRDLLRRRVHLLCPRAARRTHSQHPQRPYNLPARGQPIAAPAHRDGVAARCSAPAVPQRLEVDRALLGHADARRRAGERARLHAAKPPHANTRSRLRTVPGSGARLRLGLRYELHARQRCPRGQAVGSSGRLVTGATESAGTRDGTAGTTLGHAARTGAFADAAGLCLRAKPTGPPSRGRLENTPGQGTAVTVVAPTRARALADRWPRHPAFAMPTVRPGSRSGVGAPGAARATAGRRLAPRLGTPCATALGHAYAQGGSTSRRPGR
jgi:hypothetical protein